MSETKSRKDASKEAKKGEFTLEIDGYSCQLRKPSRQILGQAMGMVIPVNGQVPDVTRAGEWILRNCWISGDQEILEDEDLLLGASMTAMEMTKIKAGTIKKN